MTSQYQQYLLEGKSDAEALGLVIQNFGSIEELRYELNLVEYINEDIHINTSNPALLAIGACLMISGVLGCGLLYSLFLDDWICLLVFFLGVLSGTLILLWQALSRHSNHLAHLIFAISMLATGLFEKLVLTEMWVDDLIHVGFFIVYFSCGFGLLIYCLFKSSKSLYKRTSKLDLDKINNIIHPAVIR